jgi:hypothetical protein
MQTRAHTEIVGWLVFFAACSQQRDHKWFQWLETGIDKNDFYFYSQKVILPELGYWLSVPLLETYCGFNVQFCVQSERTQHESLTLMLFSAWNGRYWKGSIVFIE